MGEYFRFTARAVAEKSQSGLKRLFLGVWRFRFVTCSVQILK
jgi:hypothetical protein